MIPGIDGVGRRPDGKRVYFVAEDHVLGTMADKAIVDERRSVELTDEVDAATVAATMNPAMSAWVALRLRVPIEPGQSVLVLGATGNAGTMAIQVAKLLGAGTVVGPGRDLERLNALTGVGADRTVQLTEDAYATGEALAAAADADIVIDYVWGSRQSRRSWHCSRPGLTAAASSTGSRSARWPGQRSSCRRSHCDQRTFDSRATAKEPSRRRPISPSFPPSSIRSRPARSG